MNRKQLGMITTAAFAGALLALVTCGSIRTPVTTVEADTPKAAGSAAGATLDSELPAADARFIKETLKRFFGTFAEQNAIAALSTIKDTAAFDVGSLSGVLVTLENKEEFGKPRGYEIVVAEVTGSGKRLCEVRLFSYHKITAQGWRFRFYKTDTGAWRIVQLETRSEYVSDFVRRSELEYDSMRAGLK